MSECIDNLRDAFTALHGCECEHVGTIKVMEYCHRTLMFNEDIETFRLIDQTDEVFTWAHHDGKDVRYLAVLKIPQ